MTSWIEILIDLPLLASVLLRTTVVLGIGWILHFCLRWSNPRWRVLLWRGVIVGVLLVPMLMPLKYLEVPVPPPPVPTVSSPIAVAPVEPVIESIDIYPTDPAPELPPETVTISESSFSIILWARENIWSLISLGWALVAALAAVRFVAAFVRIRRKVRSSWPGPKHLEVLLNRVAGDLNCGRKLRLMCSTDFASPFLTGLARPVIVLPERMIDSEYADELPAVLAHEIAHLRSRDLLWMAAARWFGIVFWFHPLTWKLRDAHSTACEEVCDAVAADYVGNAESYSSTLARVALEIMGKVPAVGGIPMARSSEIMGRLRVLKRKVYASVLARHWIVLSLLAASVALAGLGGLSLVYAEAASSDEELAEKLQQSTSPRAPGTGAGEKENQVTLSRVRELVAKNEALTHLIKMDYTVRFELPGQPLVPKGGKRSSSGRSFSHYKGVWAQDGVRQYALTDYFYGPNEPARGYLQVFDGKVVKRGRRPDLMQWDVLDISKFEWDAVSVVKLGFRPFEALHRLGEILIGEYASVHDDPELVDGRGAYVVEAKRPVKPVYFAKIWMDCERGIPVRLDYYDKDPSSSEARLMCRIDSIKLHQLPNGGWIPVEGTRSLFFQNGRVISEVMTVDVGSIRIRREDIPESLFTPTFPDGAKVYNAITGQTFVQGQAQKTFEQVVQGAGKFIAGFVVDQNEVPVPDVVVKIRYLKTQGEDGKSNLELLSVYDALSSMTDTKGRFAIELERGSRYDLLFWPKNHAAVIAYDVSAGTDDLKVSLPEGGTVTGRVVRVQNGRKVPVASVEVKAEQSSRGVFTHLGFGRNRKTITDSQGRFRFDHLRTKMRSVKTRDSKEWEYVPRYWKISWAKTSRAIAFHEDSKIENVELVVEPDFTAPLSLVGKPLPEFDGIDVEFSSEQAKDKKVLVCFWDMNQRPSRRMVRELAKRAQELKGKGVAVVSVQASKVDKSQLDAWVKKYNIPFPVGMIEGDEEKVRFAWGVKSLPWLILTDKQHTVRAEGFGLEELGQRIKAATGAKLRE